MAKISKMQVDGTEYDINDSSAVHTDQIAQTTGERTDAVMSQKAVTDRLRDIEEKLGNNDKLNLGDYSFAMGTILGTGKANVWATNRAYTNAYISLQNATSFGVTIADGYKYAVNFYESESEESYNWNMVEMNSDSKEYSIPSGENYMRIVVGRTDDADITVDEALSAISVVLFFESTPIKLSVGTYNIGHFSKGADYNPAGTEDEKIAYRRILAAMRCDVIGITENDEYYDAALTEASRDAVYSMFKYYECSTKNTYDCYGVLSDYALSNEKRAYYTAQHWQGRGYYKFEITIMGKTVAFFNTQLEWSDKTIRRQQIAELLAEANKFKYSIIVGDFNPDNMTDGKVPDGETRLAAYAEDYAMWTDAGYSLANAGYYGAYNTKANDEGTAVSPWDNIIVSENIKIKSVEIIKDEFLTDHYPVCANLVIY